MKREIIKIIYGSKLYGVSTKDSDTDYKSVYIVDEVKDLYDGIKSSVNTNNGLEGKDKVEEESFYIKRFAHLLFGGQTVAYEMLFAPHKFWVNSCGNEWGLLYDRRKEIVSKNVTPFVKYARSQASKYSLKGIRLKNLKGFITDVKAFYSLGVDSDVYFNELVNKYAGCEGISLGEEIRNQHTPIPTITVCGKTFGKTTDIKLWIQPLVNLAGAFGDRSEEAMKSNGKDLKAMYHSVRIVGECIELLKDKTITFPRPDAELLMKIRLGLMELDEVSEIIDTATAEMEKLLGVSLLPETPDKDVLDNWAWNSQNNWLYPFEGY